MVGRCHPELDVVNGLAGCRQVRPAAQANSPEEVFTVRNFCGERCSASGVYRSRVNPARSPGDINRLFRSAQAHGRRQLGVQGWDRIVGHLSLLLRAIRQVKANFLQSQAGFTLPSLL